VFEGGHTLPPGDLALDAIEWTELQAMRSGRRRRDEALVSRIIEKRRARIAASSATPDIVYLLRALVSDFSSLADVNIESGRLAAMSANGDVKKALKRERDFDDAEQRRLREILELEAQLGTEGRRELALMSLRERPSTLSRTATAETDTAERRQARRLLRSITAGASGGVPDREYLALLEQYRLPGR